MNYTKARSVIMLIFLLSLIAQLAILFVCFKKEMFDAEDLTKLVVHLLTIYSVHVAVVFSISFFKSNAQAIEMSSSHIWIAITVSLLWNILIASRLVIYSGATVDDFDQVIQFQKQVSQSSAFLISGMLAYFFSKTN